MEILTSDAIQSNESDMLWFVLNFKERVKIGQENWFCRFFVYALLHPLLCPNFYQMKGVIVIHNAGKFHHYSISRCQVINFERFP